MEYKAMTVEQAKQAVAEKAGYNFWTRLEIDNEKPDPEAMYGYLNEVIDLLGAELEKHRWIPVEEKLPEFGLNVLVIGESRGMNPQMGGAYHVITKRQDLRGTILEVLSDRHQCANQFRGMSYVTHWRYLPEVP